LSLMPKSQLRFSSELAREPTTSAEIEDLEDEDEDEEETEDPAALAAAIDELRKRAGVAHIPFELRQLEDGEKYVMLQLPAGREKRSLSFFSLERIQQFLTTPFEKYVLIGPYEAICSYIDGTIEARIRPLDRMGSMSMLWRRLRGSEIGRDHPIEPLVMRLDESPTNLTLSIGTVSDALSVLLRGPWRRELSLQITGAHVAQHDNALALLERIANAVFFQIDIRYGVAFSLARNRFVNRRPRAVSRTATTGELPFPKSEYDAEPMSLYWYGRSAVGMPLLQYLAFYQVLEFYFPIYAQKDAHRRVKNILRNPAFDVHSDADVSRVLSAIKGAGGRDYGDERSQLRATLHNCVNSGNLAAFLRDDEPRKEFLSKGKALKARRIPIDLNEVDLCAEVAGRIYDIRCMIVHTKNSDSDTEMSLLLPFSKEAEALGYDIELLQFVAREVLVASSKPMRTLLV
jgi:hypothetical protein